MNPRIRAKNLIKKWGTNNPKLLCKYLKITVLYAELGDVNGYYTKCIGNKVIVVNEKLDNYSRNVVLSHELGHAILHGRDILFMKTNFLSCRNTIYEKEANLFAIELLKNNKEYIYSFNLGIDIMEDLKNLE